MSDTERLLAEFEEWVADRRDIVERDNMGGLDAPDDNEWESSDGRALALLDRMAGQLRRDNAEYLTVDEIATRLVVSKMTVYRLCHSGDLPAVRFGRSFRVSKANLADYLQKNETGRH